MLTIMPKFGLTNILCKSTTLPTQVHLTYVVRYPECSYLPSSLSQVHHSEYPEAYFSCPELMRIAAGPPLHGQK